jgi:hypothetical protein
MILLNSEKQYIYKMYMYRGRRRSTAAVTAAAEEKRTTTIVVVQNVSVAHAHAITSGSWRGTLPVT